MKIFKVKTNNWKEYFVAANNFEEAADKTLNFLVEETKEKPLIDSDGSLYNITIPSITGVDLLTDKLIR